MRTAITIAIGVLLAFSLIYFARPISGFIVNKISRGPRIENTPIAYVVRTEGGAFVRTGDSAKFLPVKSELPLYLKDEIKTERTGRLHIKMTSGYELELLPESQMILDRWSPKGGPEYFSLTRGNIRVIREGKKGDLYIQQNSRTYLPGDAATASRRPMPIYLQNPGAPNTTSNSKNPPPLPATVATPTPENRVGNKMPEKKIKSVEDSTTLTSAYIETILGNQAQLFRRCQLSSLRDGAVSAGNLTLAFSIEKDGKTADVRVITSNLRNKELEKCSVDVIERTKFKPYTGTDVQLSYPIEFR